MTERTPEQKAALEEWKRTAKCDTCGNPGVLGVAAMPGVPASFAYCAACHAANAHPYGIVVANTAMIGGDLAQAAPWWNEIVDCTLTHLGISREKFEADVAENIAEERAYFARLEAEEAAGDRQTITEEEPW